MPLAHILVVEDDSAIRRGLCDALRFAGYTVADAPDGEAGLEAASTQDFDIVLFDILMPKMDGITALTKLRERKPGIPAIFLTARGEEADRVKGLRIGADDYVVKPFSATELIARVEAVLRRSPERPRSIPTLVIAGRTIDFRRREATLLDGSRILLAQKEAEVLEYLARNHGRAISRDELLQHVWKLDPRGMQTRTVDMAVARLREQLGDDPNHPTIIVTVRAKGYMLALPETDTNHTEPQHPDTPSQTHP